MKATLSRQIIIALTIVLLPLMVTYQSCTPSDTTTPTGDPTIFEDPNNGGGYAGNNGGGYAGMLYNESQAGTCEGQQTNVRTTISYVAETNQFWLLRQNCQAVTPILLAAAEVSFSSDTQTELTYQGVTLSQVSTVATEPTVPAGTILNYLTTATKFDTQIDAGQVGLEIEFLVGDIDGDKKSDLLGRDKNTSKLYSYKSDGKVFQYSNLDLGAIGTEHQLALADFNGDKKADLISRNKNTGNISYYSSNGSTFAFINSIGGIGGNMELYFVEVNGDGFVDILSRDRNTGTLYVYLNTSSPFTNNATFNFAGPAASGFINKQLFFGDFDDNGVEDLLARDENGQMSTFNALCSTGSCTFQFNRDAGNIGVEMEIFLADLDGNDRKDLITRRVTDGMTHLYLSEASGFSYFSSSTEIGTKWSLSIADIDGDGKADLTTRYTPLGYVRDYAQFPWY